MVDTDLLALFGAFAVCVPQYFITDIFRSPLGVPT